MIAAVKQTFKQDLEMILEIFKKNMFPLRYLILYCQEKTIGI